MKKIDFPPEIAVLVEEAGPDFLETARTLTESRIEKAIKVVGNQKRLADTLGVSTQAITKWRRRIPAERVLDIERATGGEVTRQQLRPDLYPEDTAA